VRGRDQVHSAAPARQVRRGAVLTRALGHPSSHRRQIELFLSPVHGSRRPLWQPPEYTRRLQSLCISRRANIAENGARSSMACQGSGIRCLLRVCVCARARACVRACVCVCVCVPVRVRAPRVRARAVSLSVRPRLRGKPKGLIGFLRASSTVTRRHPRPSRVPRWWCP
jgi:hypothetical protein